MIEFNAKRTGERIKELRLELEISQTKLASQIGVASNTLTQYEKGTASPSLTVLVRLAFALNTTTDYLFGIKEE